MKITFSWIPPKLHALCSFRPAQSVLKTKLQSRRFAPLFVSYRRRCTHHTREKVWQWRQFVPTLSMVGYWQWTQTKRNLVTRCERRWYHSTNHCCVRMGAHNYGYLLRFSVLIVKCVCFELDFFRNYLTQVTIYSLAFLKLLVNDVDFSKKGTRTWSSRSLKLRFTYQKHLNGLQRITLWVHFSYFVILHVPQYQKLSYIIGSYLWFASPNISFIIPFPDSTPI